MIPATLVAAGVVIPLLYLVIRAFGANFSTLGDLVFRPRTLELLVNTLILAGGVLVVTAALALPLAWLTTRTDLPGRSIFTLIGVLPLAIPGYILAYAVLATTGPEGTLTYLLPLSIPRPQGYTGALIALSIYTYPYLFLNLRASLRGLDPGLEESARSLGYTTPQVLTRVILPQLRPAFYSGGLIVGLHVLGDFGVVSLMRYETFSYALYIQYSAAFDRTYAAWLALILLALTSCILILEARLLRGLYFHRVGPGTRREPSRIELGKTKWLAYVFLGVVGLISVVIPVTTVLYWMGAGGIVWSEILPSVVDSVSASAPSAIFAALLALPMAYLSVRRPTRLTRSLERTAYLGYAIPPLALALALIFFCLTVTPWVYQTLGLLIFAYTLHFLAEAIGPIRSTLYQVSPKVEEVARSLGRSRIRAFLETTFPLVRKSLFVSVAFVFLSAMKELPITFLLSPAGFQSLAINAWSYAGEAMFDQAAPYALAIIICSLGFVGILLSQEPNSS